MNNVTNTFRSGEYRLILFDDGTTLKDRVVPGKIISIDISEETRQVNSNGRVFYNASVEGNFNGVKQVGPAILWDDYVNSPAVPENSFIPDTHITLAIQVQGDEAGTAYIEFSEPINIKNRIALSELPITMNYQPPAVQYFENEYEEELPDVLINSPTDNKKENDGCVRIFFSFFFSLIIIGLILSPFTFLGFILYPVWVGGTIILSNFIYRMGEPKNSTKNY